MKSFFAFLSGCALIAATEVRAADPALVPPPVEKAADAPPRSTLTRDLGRNLVYHRLQRLPEDLAAIDASRNQPRVLDLRYLRADDAGAAALHAWIKSNATPRTPVFVLANSATARDLVAPYAGRNAAGHVLVIGASTRAFRPDIAVEISADDERRAYDALEAGAELATLLTENPTKVRNDEASLSRDRSSEAAAPTPASDAPKNEPAPPIDAALQRAVHLHRTLVALRKI